MPNPCQTAQITCGGSRLKVGASTRESRLLYVPREPEKIMTPTRYTQDKIATLRCDTAPIKPASNTLRGFFDQRKAHPSLVREVYSGDVVMPERTASKAWITQPVYYAITRDRVSRKIK